MIALSPLAIVAKWLLAGLAGMLFVWGALRLLAWWEKKDELLYRKLCGRDKYGWGYDTLPGKDGK